MKSKGDEYGDGAELVHPANLVRQLSSRSGLGSQTYFLSQRMLGSFRKKVKCTPAQSVKK
jgi:hypothetical protein